MIFKKLILLKSISILFLLSAVFNLGVAVPITDEVHENTNLRLLFKSHNGSLWQVGIEGEEPKIVNMTIDSPVVDFDYNGEKNRIIWLSKKDAIYQKDWKYYNNANKTEDKFLVWYDYGTSTNRRITLDHVTDHIYSINTIFDPTIETIDFNGIFRSVLLEFGNVDYTKDYSFIKSMPQNLIRSNDNFKDVLEFPLEIALDSYAGFLFIRTNHTSSSKIHRANMDGTALKLIVPDSGKVGNNNSWILDVDHFSRRIYWANREKGVIESVDYDGNDRVIVVKTEKPFTLSVHNNHLFWVQDLIDSSTGINIKICTLNNYTCDAEHIKDIPLKGITTIPEKLKVVSSVNSWPFRRNDTNPCADGKHDCQQLCLLKPSNLSLTDPTYGCACRVGYKLAANLKNCTYTQKMLVYESNDYLKGKDLSSLDNNKNYAFPKKSLKNKLKGDQIAAVDYDVTSHKFFYMGCCNMPFMFDLNTYIQDYWFLDTNKTDQYRDLAYDYELKKLYTVNFDESIQKYVLKVTDALPKDAPRDKLTPLTLHIIDEPLSLVVHPKSGFLYVLTIDRTLNESKITRMHAGDSKMVILQNADTKKARGLAIDNKDDRLYWYTSLGVIQHVNLNGDDAKTLSGKSPVIKINNMVVDDEWIYIKNLTSIWRVRKGTGEEAVCVVPETKFTVLRSGMRIVENPPEVRYLREINRMTSRTCKVYKFYNPEDKTMYSFKDICESIAGTEEFVKYPLKSMRY